MLLREYFDLHTSHFTTFKSGIAVENNMPKRGKKGQEETEQERRPPDLTLASFLSGSLASQSLQNSSKNSEASTSTTEPELGLQEEQAGTEKLGFFVKRTKKGKLPISYENRAKGKKVTVISNVTGDPSILLQELKKKIGAGGVVRGDCVEIQGDHQAVVESFLKSRRSCLK